jgi:hypothetical protein
MHQVQSDQTSQTMLLSYHYQVSKTIWIYLVLSTDIYKISDQNQDKTLFIMSSYH